MGEKRTLLKNIRIVNPCASQALTENGFIIVQGETIEHVGSLPPEDRGFDDVLDLRDKTVLPGMINAHTHLYGSLSLGMPALEKAPRNFVEILQEIWWKQDRALDAESTRASFEAGIMDCLLSGVTTIFDHHSSQNFVSGSLDMLVEVAERFGVNISTAFEITDRNGTERFEEGLKENLVSLEEYSDRSHVHPMVGLHASFTLSDESLKQIRDSLEGKKDWGIHIHVAEDRSDQEDAAAKGYPSVIQRLRRWGLINDKSLIIHGIHILPGDLETLIDSGAFLVHNPSSNANNRVGMLAGETIQSMRAGLGTDGMQENMLAEAKQGTLIRSSHLSGNAENVNYLDLLFGNNPRIADHLFGRKLGCILPGYQADLAIFDYEPRTAMTESNLQGHLLFGLGKPTDVMTRGRFRIRDSKFVDVSEEEVREKGRVQSIRLWEKMLQL